MLLCKNVSEMLIKLIVFRLQLVLLLHVSFMPVYRGIAKIQIHFFSVIINIFKLFITHFTSQRFISKNNTVHYLTYTDDSAGLIEDCIASPSLSDAPLYVRSRFSSSCAKFQMLYLGGTRMHRPVPHGTYLWWLRADSSSSCT